MDKSRPASVPPSSSPVSPGPEEAPEPEPASGTQGSGAGSVFVSGMTLTGQEQTGGARKRDMSRREVSPSEEVPAAGIKKARLTETDIFAVGDFYRRVFECLAGGEDITRLTIPPGAQAWLTELAGLPQRPEWAGLFAQEQTDAPESAGTDISRHENFYHLLQALVKGNAPRSRLLRNQMAAEYARDKAAHTDKSEYLQLSSMMCWHSVIWCMHKAGVLTDKEYNRLMMITATEFSSLVSTQDTPVQSPAAMRGVPQGSVLGFFDLADRDNPRLIHVMLATGHGLAAGNKNSCTGTGSHFGWEQLDLAGGLRWMEDRGCVNVFPPGKRERPVHIFYRTF